jgi:hypothetical protein
MVREGEEVQIIDNNTKDDLTEITLAQIIYEEQKAHSRNVPLQTLKELIHSAPRRCWRPARRPHWPAHSGENPGGQRRRACRRPSEEREATLVDQAKEKLEEDAAQLDERINSILASFRPLQQLQQEVASLNERYVFRKAARAKRY